MSDDDHKGQKKIQAWIKQETWDMLESLGYTSPTTAVTDAFNMLIEKSPKNPEESQSIPELRAQLEGLRLLLEEKDQRIADLRQDKETLSIFAHYFKSLEYKRIESQGQHESIKTEPRERKGEESKKTASEPEKSRREATEGQGEESKIRKECPYCGKIFFTDKKDKIYCGQDCKDEFYNEKRRNERKEKRKAMT